jgi:hypothetical protein
MPEGRETGRIGDRYQLDYYRHPRPTRSWKWPLTAAAALGALAATGAVFGLWGKRAFHAASVSRVHASFGDDCAKCHDASWQPALRLVTGSGTFRSVSNSSCLACHASTADHHWTTEVDRSSGGSPPACAACHTEHRPEQHLQSVADSLCLSCHRDLEGQPGFKGAFAQRISGFSAGADRHPEFAILTREETAPASDRHMGAVAQRDAKTGGGWRDVGGLIFNHAVHLADEGVLAKGRTPRVLKCGDCHSPSADGALMAPINYEQHCRECHPLQLGGDLARFGQIPHESPAILRGLLREKLATERATESQESAQPVQLEQSTDAGFPRLLPGPAHLSAPIAEAVDAELDDLDHALFGLEARGFCRKCHHVQAQGDSWHVLLTNPQFAAPKTAAAPSTMVPNRWYHHAQFNHEKHRVAAKCADCHQAETSTSTSDILLPSIDSCRRCHGSEATVDGISAGESCTQCHEYHTDDLSVHP